MMNEVNEHPFSLSELFHLNTKVVESMPPLNFLPETELLRGSIGCALKLYPTAQKIYLPPVLDIECGFYQAVVNRMSVREWIDQPITIEQISTILALSAGIIRTGEYKGRTVYYRPSPSGGGRYPIEIYPVIFRAENIEPGIYHYNCNNHELDVLKQDSAVEREMLDTTTLPQFLKNTGMILLMTSVWERTIGKYSDRGYRYVFLEAGHIAQNICLTAAALNLGSLCIGGFLDQKTEQMLWLDGITESTIYLIAVGWPDRSLISNRPETG